MGLPVPTPSQPFAICNHALRAGGGIERYALTLVRGLHTRGIRTTFIAKSFDPDLPEYTWVDPVRLSVTGVPGKLRDRWFDWKLSRLKRRSRWFPLVACNQTAAADLAICGSNHPAYLAAMGQTPKLSDRWKTTLEAAQVHNARLVVAHSRGLMQQLAQHHGVAADKMRLLYPPVDGEDFSPVDEARRTRLRESLGLPAGRAVFLLASTGHLRKGLDLLLEVFARTALPASLVVAGRPIPQTGPNVRWLGYRNDMADVYRAVDCTVLASRYEPFGLVGVESVLCGTPVIVAGNVGCAEVLRPTARLRFELGTPGSLEQALESAVERWRAGSLRLAVPREHLAYDPSVDVHLEALLGWIGELQQTRSRGD